MTTLSRSHLNRVFNVRSRFFRRWLARRLRHFGRPAVPFGEADLARLFREWATSWCPAALQDDAPAPHPRGG